MKYYSQYGQDEYILNKIFYNKPNGYYVDIGAHDGISLSNTKVLEDVGWDGVCIEPHPERFKELKYNRKCICYDFAISDENELIDFLCIEGYPQMLSGILKNYDQRHLQRVNNELNLCGGNKTVIKVHSKKFSDIIEVKNIDYVSIDVEGSELNILKSIDFNIFNIKCFSIENAYSSNDLNNFLLNRGYYMATTMGCDIIFVKR